MPFFIILATTAAAADKTTTTRVEKVPFPRSANINQDKTESDCAATGIKTLPLLLVQATEHKVTRESRRTEDRGELEMVER